MATSIDDNEADEKSDKPRCQLIFVLPKRVSTGELRDDAHLKEKD